MSFPGSRTLRRVTRDALAPARVISDQLGVSASAERLRRWATTKVIERAGREGAGLFGDRAAADWARLTVDASEPSGYFFSENLVSNEIEFLHAASALATLPPDLAYVGVGPEPMLSYVGLVETPLAFVVDIRRDNARLHYLYRGIFECASSRYEWLSMLLGLPYRDVDDPGPDASIDVVLAAIGVQSATEESFRTAHGRIRRALDALPAHRLPLDRRRMRRIHRYFWRYGTELTFQLGGLRLRRYPTLQCMLCASTPEGHQLGFLANEGTYRQVSTLERSSRLVPIVGDISGRALLRLAAELRARDLLIGALYISNVEQYLFENAVWNEWTAALEQLPWHKDAVIIRSYFENERGPVPDPPSSLWGQIERSFAVALETKFGKRELPVHQMRTVVHGLSAFLERQRRCGYQGFRELVCDTTIQWATR